MSKKTFKKIVLDDLKSAGLGHLSAKIVSIKHKTYAGGSSLNVDTIDLFKSDRERLKAFLDEYADGKFDGSYDIYIYSDKDSQKERTAKYVFLRNEFSDKTKAHVARVLEAEWDIHDNQSAMLKMRCWYDQAVWRLIQDLEELP